MKIKSLYCLVKLQGISKHLRTEPIYKNILMKGGEKTKEVSAFKFEVEDYRIETPKRERKVNYTNFKETGIVSLLENFREFCWFLRKFDSSFSRFQRILTSIES